MITTNSRSKVPTDPWQQELDQHAQHVWIENKGKRPAFAAHFWPRVELLQQAMQHHPIAWISAPPGYGKTLLMSEYCSDWQQHSEAPGVMWFRCDERDAPNDCFLHHLLAVAERQLEGVATNALAHWHFSVDRGELDVEQVLLLWLAELATFERPLVLCLDDAHTLSEFSAIALLGKLILNRPDNLRIIITSRYLPQPLGRLRLEQNIAWLNERQLSFSDDHVQRWLMANDIDQAGRLVPQLNSRLKGWPAGLSLWLACYRALGKPFDPPVLLGQQEMSDYLQGETLFTLSPELQRFIQQAAILESFNDSLLQDCLQNSDFKPQLNQALALNVFIQAREDKPGWYRIHPVMAELLGQQLPLHTRQELHRKAFDWHKNSSDRIAALHHARQAGIAQDVVPWVETQAEYIIASLDIAAMLEWFEVLGQELIQSSPRLMQIAAWSWLFTQQREKAEPLVQQLQRDHRLQDYERAALEGYLARLAGQNKKAQQLCKQALEELPAERFTIRILMISTLSSLCLMNNDADGARIWNRLAQDMARQFQVPAMEAQALFEYARIELNRGHIQRSTQVIQQGLELLAVNSEAYGLAQGRLLNYKAFLLWLSGAAHKPLVELVQQGISASTHSHDIAVCYGYAIFAMVKAEMGKFDRALDILDQAERLMQRWQVGVESYQWLAMIKANIWISQGKLSRAQGYIDEFVKMQQGGPLRSDMFPMLPGFIAATRARGYLVGNNPQACVQEADNYARTNGHSIMSLLMNMIRAAGLRAMGSSDSDSQIKYVQQMLERAGICMNIDFWIPNLRLSGNNPYGDDLPASVALSERELEVLRKIDQGLSNQEIADQLFISLHTVKTHARKINVKLGSKNRTQALHRAKELLLI